MAREYILEINEIGATLTSIEKVLDLPKLLNLKRLLEFQIYGMTPKKLRQSQVSYLVFNQQSPASKDCAAALMIYQFSLN
jgi:hypothetical protein